MVPGRIFQSVGRYEGRTRFLQPAQTIRDILNRKSGINYKFVETGSGHGLVGFRSVFPEALAWILPAK